MAKRNRIRRKKEPWQPFKEVDQSCMVGPDPQALADSLGIPLDQVKHHLEQEFEGVLIFVNNYYQVVVKEAQGIPEHMPAMLYLSIKRLDKLPIRDWRHMQRIKNELVGEEHEAVELYPAESRLVDTANQYHLWVLKEPNLRFWFGFNSGRWVLDSSAEDQAKTNTRQRKLE